MRLIFSTLLVAQLGLGAFCLSGCGSTETAAPPATADNPNHDGEHGSHDHATEGAHASSDHDHGGWWCTEHGVPEGECALCDTSLVSGFKEKADWCDEHNRPESQCFTCNPENFAKFAARYEAKFGHQPPEPTE
ncbi:MAG: RND transporter [Pirellulaceae bacterium]|nr:RND transporter [Pirellulaceae bacterium]